MNCDNGICYFGLEHMLDAVADFMRLGHCRLERHREMEVDEVHLPGTLLACVRGAVGGLTAKMIEDHVKGRTLVAGCDAACRKGTEELNDIVRSYLK